MTERNSEQRETPIVHRVFVSGEILNEYELPEGDYEVLDRGDGEKSISYWSPPRLINSCNLDVLGVNTENIQFGDLIEIRRKE